MATTKALWITLFERLQMREPGHIALKYYNNYRFGSAKTLKFIRPHSISGQENGTNP
jgi:hypothetical protein